MNSSLAIINSIANGSRRCPGQGPQRLLAAFGPILLTLLLVLPAGAMTNEIEADTPHYSKHYWLREDGLPQNTVTAVVQTRDGYIWVGTYDGLARFDGVRFTVFDGSSTPGLASGRITSLFEDGAGTLWIGHGRGELTRYANGKFATLPVKAQWGQGKIARMATDEAGDLWMQNEDGLLARERDGLVLTPEPGNYSGNLQLVRNQQGTIWVGRNGRISLLQHDLLVPLKLSDDTNGSIIGIGSARDNGLWLVTSNRLREWKAGHWTEDRGVSPFDGAPISQLFEARNGTLIGATSDHGFGLISPDRRAIIFRRATGFSTDWAQSICQDREGDLWVGTGGSGLAEIQECRVQAISPPDAWQGRAVLSVCNDPMGGLWIGTEGSGVYHFRDRVWTNYAFNEGLENPYVWSLAVDLAGDLWAGTWSGGLFVRHGERFDTPPGLDSNITPVTALLAARRGGLWAGTAQGLLRYDSAGAISWFARPTAHAKNDVRCVLEAQDGSVWFGTDGEGLLRLRDGVLQSFHQTNGLPNEFILCLHEDNNGAIWIGTSGGGLGRYRDGHFSVINEKQGLGDKVICDIEDDGNGYYWFGSHNGLMRVSKQLLDLCADGTMASIYCNLYGISDGMPTLECSGGMQPAACKTPDGHLWFATSRGLVSVNPNAIKTNPLPPPVVIEKLSVDGQVVATVPAPDLPLKIPPGWHRLEFQYTGLSLLAPEKVHFKHRLVGLDSDWVEAGTSRTVNYNYIPPGRYTLRVIACNNDGVWNDTGDSFSFILLPHYWQTGWFRVVTIAGLSLLAAGGAWNITRRRMRIKLEQVERQRALERERTRIARDIHDDLGASLTRINLMSQSARRSLEDVPQTAKNLDQICTTARQLTRAMDEIVWAVDPQHDTLDSLANYFSKLIHELLADSGIRCRLDFPVYLPAWPVTAEIRHNLFLAFKETLHNLLKHSGATEVQISLTLKRAAFAVKIQDNGRGFNPAAEENSVPPRRNGLGNMRQRLQEIGGSCEIQSQPGQGTQVTFVLPMKFATR